MATIEVHAQDKISIYEVSDAGCGIDLEVGRDEEGNYGIWVGPRGMAGGRCLTSGRYDDLPCDFTEAMTKVGENENWQVVKLNGSVIWSSEATEAVKDALAEDKDEFEFEVC